MLKLLESLLCCPRAFLFLFSFSSSVSFSDLIKTCYSTYVLQALRNQAYSKTLATFIVVTVSVMADRNDECSAGEGSGASSSSDFSSFREIIREEREAARAEREAAAAEARVERETAAAEQLRLMAGVYELNCS